MHLLWLVPDGPLQAVRATLEVIDPPQTDDLYFFAMQASFTADGLAVGGAHIGLQWNRRHPGNTAANWGGYQSQARGGQVLAGTDSPLPSRPDDPNTRDYSWAPRKRYRFEISPGTREGWWLGSITDLAAESTARIRELHGGGNALSAPMVWCEVFAPCDAPTVTAAWSDLGFSPDGKDWLTVGTVKTNYQDFTAGGCTNTNSSSTAGRWLQETNVIRTTAGQAELSL